ncbi:dephospho-CoA kinase [Jiangella rhizosphaerae]|uniref:Dephospho-CoA kinase n=1 Tax=Jiangella rhizosphaerae TaxID=2293569 RepID=A0A418KPS2_9ACTN|nr:dephospho-CoA kinase [Jiangella rhizosphaerae]RIQ21360.1 dephospho-CoA kinase [Jiangella rhizosphaerae]
MLRVGLTGGIGAGKSVVARRLAERGATIVDADLIAREVVEPGTPGLAAVVDEFGPGVLTPDGALDRPALGTIVFADEDRRRALNAIVHPLVGRRRQQLVAAAGPDAVVVEDIPLLVENGLTAGFPLVVVVHAPESERLRRLVEDRGMAEADALARIRAQATDEQRRAAGDVWLDNSGPLVDTQAAVDALWKERLVPFEANLRTRTGAPRPPHAVIADPDPTWAVQGERLLGRIRRIAGDRLIRSDHHGSTSVPGLPAKDVIDVQLVVADLDTAASVAADLAEAGLVRLPDRWWDVDRDGVERDKVLCANADPGRPVNCHIRPVTSPTWRDALLLRDWLRAHPDAVGEYAALKRGLAAQPHASVDEYATRKTPWINQALARADAWAAEVGWRV